MAPYTPQSGRLPGGGRLYVHGPLRLRDLKLHQALLVLYQRAAGGDLLGVAVRVQLLHYRPRAAAGRVGHGVHRLRLLAAAQHRHVGQVLRGVDAPKDHHLHGGRCAWHRHASSGVREPRDGHAAGGRVGRPGPAPHNLHLGGVRVNVKDVALHGLAAEAAVDDDQRRGRPARVCAQHVGARHRGRRVRAAREGRWLHGAPAAGGHVQDGGVVQHPARSVAAAVDKHGGGVQHGPGVHLPRARLGGAHAGRSPPRLRGVEHPHVVQVPALAHAAKHQDGVVRQLARAVGMARRRLLASRQLHARPAPAERVQHQHLLVTHPRSDVLPAV
mmetsp:Transcript_43601/g.112906  ORF Transcript_43601/g.112906 Transcript_43601/m.112906 type:complete len:329 (+) Transcript_43601:66-1052(+)